MNSFTRSIHHFTHIPIGFDRILVDVFFFVLESKYGTNTQPNDETTKKQPEISNQRREKKIDKQM